MTASYERFGTSKSDFLAGGGEMGARTRAFDWSQAPVGPVESWPHSLTTAVSICLGSRHPICLWWGQQELTQFYNDGFISFLGAAKHPGALGQSAKECWSEIWHIISGMLEGVFATGEATWSEDFLYVLNRNLPREEGYFTFSYSPIRDDFGSVNGIFCACSETTGRVLGERRLRTLRDLGQKATMANSAEQACEIVAETLAGNPHDIPFSLIYLLDAGGRYARVVGTSGLDASCSSSWPQIDVSEPVNRSDTWPLKRVFDTGNVELVSDLAARFGPLPGGPWPESPEAALILPVAALGETRPIGFLVAGLSPRRIVDADYRSFFDLIAGHVGTAVANARAYEQERRRAEALAEIDRAKTAFFSNVSHEFRTPLTLMLGPTEDLLAMKHDVLPTGPRDLVAVVHRNALRLQKLVNALLDFSRIEAGRMQASYEPTDLATLTSELASNFRAAVEKAGMRLLVDCPPLPEPIYVDRDMWEKVVLNLLSNAFKFTLEGEIAVTLSDAGDTVQLSVRDTGVGIPKDQLEHVFERFRRVEVSRARTHEGTGIGLALVQELVKLHRGTVRVESVFGKGSTFTVAVSKGTAHLPVEQIGAGRTLASTALTASHYIEEALRWLPEDPMSSREDSSTGAQSVPSDTDVRRGPPVGSTRRPRIVWADDNADMRDYVRRLLSDRYDVEAVADGEAALAAARRDPPDLVLADVMMPRLDGFRLLNALRADERTRTLPIILLSARAAEESRVEGLEAGADDYLVKPFTARELLARVGSNLELARLRREAAEALLQSEERLKLFIHYAPAAIAMFDKDMKYLAASRRFLQDYHVTETEVIGRSYYEVFPDVPERWREFHQRGLRGEIIQAQEDKFERADGSVQWLHWEIHPWNDAHGNVGGVLMFAEEITQRKEAEQEREILLTREREARERAEEAGRLKDEFLATVSHELRTPLTAVLGWAQVLRGGHLVGERAAVALETIERNARAQNQLINDLLDVSRIIAGKLRLDVRPIDPVTPIEAAIESVYPAASAKGVRVQKVIDRGVGLVSGDANRLQQVVWNLLSNSIKFTPRGGHVQFRLERVDSHIEMTVTDTGVGIKPEFLPFVFERFRQGDARTTREHGGLGLGLSIVRHLVELHGGTVTAQSHGENQGSTFTVRLPLVPVYERPEVEERGHSRASHSLPRLECSNQLDGLSVLVVDDERDTCELLKTMLEKSGALVTIATSAESALDHIERASFDLIVSDIGMPGKDGYQLIQTLRTLSPDRGGAIPAIALTAYSRSEDRLRALQTGYQMHIPKPIEYGELITAMASLVNRRNDSN